MTTPYSKRFEKIIYDINKNPSEHNSKFISQIVNGSFFDIKSSIIHNKSYLGFVDSENRTIPHYIIDNPKFNNHDKFLLIKYSFENGAPIDIPDAQGVRILHIASQQQNNKLINFLLQNGAEPNSTDINQYQPIHYALSPALKQEIKDRIDISPPEKTIVDIEIDDMLEDTYKLFSKDPEIKILIEHLINFFDTNYKNIIENYSDITQNGKQYISDILNSFAKKNLSGQELSNKIKELQNIISKNLIASNFNKSLSIKNIISPDDSNVQSDNTEFLNKTLPPNKEYSPAKYPNIDSNIVYLELLHKKLKLFFEIHNFYIDYTEDITKIISSFKIIFDKTDLSPYVLTDFTNFDTTNYYMGYGVNIGYGKFLEYHINLLKNIDQIFKNTIEDKTNKEILVQLQTKIKLANILDIICKNITSVIQSLHTKLNEMKFSSDDKYTELKKIIEETNVGDMFDNDNGFFNIKNKTNKFISIIKYPKIMEGGDTLTYDIPGLISYGTGLLDSYRTIYGELLIQSGNTTPKQPNIVCSSLHEYLRLVEESINELDTFIGELGTNKDNSFSRFSTIIYDIDKNIDIFNNIRKIITNGRIETIRGDGDCAFNAVLCGYHGPEKYKEININNIRKDVVSKILNGKEVLNDEDIDRIYRYYASSWANAMMDDITERDKINLRGRHPTRITIHDRVEVCTDIINKRKTLFSELEKCEFYSPRLSKFYVINSYNTIMSGRRDKSVFEKAYYGGEQELAVLAELLKINLKQFSYSERPASYLDILTDIYEDDRDDSRTIFIMNVNNNHYNTILFDEEDDRESGGEANGEIKDKDSGGEAMDKQMGEDSGGEAMDGESLLLGGNTEGFTEGFTYDDYLKMYEIVIFYNELKKLYSLDKENPQIIKAINDSLPKLTHELNTVFKGASITEIDINILESISLKYGVNKNNILNRLNTFIGEIKTFKNVPTTDIDESGGVPESKASEMSYPMEAAPIPVSVSGPAPVPVPVPVAVSAPVAAPAEEPVAAPVEESVAVPVAAVVPAPVPGPKPIPVPVSGSEPAPGLASVPVPAPDTSIENFDDFLKRHIKEKGIPVSVSESLRTNLDILFREKDYNLEGKKALAKLLIEEILKKIEETIQFNSFFDEYVSENNIPDEMSKVAKTSSHEYFEKKKLSLEEKKAFARLLIERGMEYSRNAKKNSTTYELYFPDTVDDIINIDTFMGQITEIKNIGISGKYIKDMCRKKLKYIYDSSSNKLVSKFFYNSISDIEDVVLSKVEGIIKVVDDDKKIEDINDEFFEQFKTDKLIEYYQGEIEIPDSELSNIAIIDKSYEKSDITSIPTIEMNREKIVYEMINEKLDEHMLLIKYNIIKRIIENIKEGNNTGYNNVITNFTDKFKIDPSILLQKKIAKHVSKLVNTIYEQLVDTIIINYFSDISNKNVQPQFIDYQNIIMNMITMNLSDKTEDEFTQELIEHATKYEGDIQHLQFFSGSISNEEHVEKTLSYYDTSKNKYEYDIDEDVINTLISHGANINAVQREGFTPLIMAINLESISIIQLLINNGAIISDKSESKIDAYKFCFEKLLRVIESSPFYNSSDTFLRVREHLKEKLNTKSLPKYVEYIIPMTNYLLGHQLQMVAKSYPNMWNFQSHHKIVSDLGLNDNQSSLPIIRIHNMVEKTEFKGLSGINEELNVISKKLIQKRNIIMRLENSIINLEKEIEYNPKLLDKNLQIVTELKIEKDNIEKSADQIIKYLEKLMDIREKAKETRHVMKGGSRFLSNSKKVCNVYNKIFDDLSDDKEMKEYIFYMNIWNEMLIRTPEEFQKDETQLISNLQFNIYKNKIVDKEIFKNGYQEIIDLYTKVLNKYTMDYLDMSMYLNNEIENYALKQIFCIMRHVFKHTIAFDFLNMIMYSLFRVKSESVDTTPKNIYDTLLTSGFIDYVFDDMTNDIIKSVCMITNNASDNNLSVREILDNTIEQLSLPEFISLETDVKINIKNKIIPFYTDYIETMTAEMHKTIVLQLKSLSQQTKLLQILNKLVQ
jgi:ankyrin repeat protein